MKKQLIAAAVATAIAVPMAASADVTVYGKLHYSIDNIDYDSGVSGAIPGTGNDSLDAGYDGWGVNSHASRFGIKGSEDLGNGLSAVFQMEFQIDGDDLGAVSNNRNTYVALAGNFGVAGIGQVDTPFKSSTASLELFGDSTGDYNQLYFDDIRTRDAVFYMSPNWNGLSFVAAAVLPSTSLDADGVEATSLSATYSNGPFFATLAFEGISGEYVDDLYAGAGIAGTVTDDMNYDKWRLGLGYTANGLHVGFIYEDRDIDHVGDGNSWQLSGSYTMGNNVFKVAYGEVEDIINNTHAAAVGDLFIDGDQWTVGLDHKLSSRTKLYATYSNFDNNAANMDWDALSFGIVHSF
jgi:predicted porin